MKSKGFTLIELLAVIVILAVIALIATPMILGVIDTARKGAAESSAYGYIEALENYQVMQQVTNPNSSLFDSFKYVDYLNGLIEIKGEKPTKGVVFFDNGKITNYELQFGEYLVKYNATSKKAEAAKGEFAGLGSVAPNPVYAVGDQVTIDGVSYHVIKSSPNTDTTVTLLRDESIGTMAFDENGSTDYETSTLKTYLNSTYKETFGEKASMIVGDVTLLDFGSYTSNNDGYSAASDIDGLEGTYAYLLKNGYSSILGTDYLWTKTVYHTGDDIIIECNYDEDNNNYLISVARYLENGYYVNSALGGAANPSFGFAVRPVITISKEAISA